MKPFVILTATYNHPNELKALFASLQEQTDKEFTWIIVDDGSKEDTTEAIDVISKQATIDVFPVHQNNGGKSRAINNGLDQLTRDVKFFVIVDDDEKLKPNAIEIIKQYYEAYKKTNCGVIHFNRLNEKGKMIARPVIGDDFIMSYQRFKSEGRFADGYLGYFTDKLGKTRFTVYDEEKYVGPSVLFMQVTDHSDLLWAKEALGETEYLAGGITKQGRKLRIKNPRGMIDYCKLMQKNGASWKTKIAYSVQGYAYYQFIDKPKRNRAILKGLLPFRLSGKILGQYWKSKFLLDAGRK